LALVVGRQGVDLHGTQVLQARQDVLREGAPADDQHLVHRSDHGKTCSMTAATARSRFAAALALRASAVSRAERTTSSRTAAASLAAASASALARASAFALASASSLAASARAFSMLASASA